MRLSFTTRTTYAWKPEPVSDVLIHTLYEAVKLGPTAANSTPARFVFLKSPEAKERLVPALMEANIDKTRTSGVTVIVAYDTEFYDQLPKLFPHRDMREYFAGNPAVAEENAFRNSSMQGGYLILAARALGLDAGPMSGFDPEKVNAEFFPDGKWKANFLVNLGYGDHTNDFPRLPRLTFEEAARIL